MTNYSNSVISILTMTPERPSPNGEHESSDASEWRKFWEDEKRKADEEDAINNRTNIYTYIRFETKEGTVELVGGHDPDDPLVRIDDPKAQGRLDEMAHQTFGEISGPLDYQDNFLRELRRRDGKDRKRSKKPKSGSGPLNPFQV
jgi:hypothetical protein